MRLGVRLTPHALPPTADGLNRKGSGVTVGGDTHPSVVASEIVHAVGRDLAQFGVGEVVDVDLFGLTFALPLLARALELASSLFLVSHEITSWPSC